MNAASLRFALRMLWRDLRAGELAAVFLALVIAVAALSSVNLFADRVQRALKIHAAELLAANLLINSDHPVPDQFADEARRRGLRLAETRVFSSMALHPQGAQLVTAKAVSSAYPLLGQLQMSLPAVAFASAPKPGEVWVDERMAQRTGIRIGQSLQLGNSQLRVAGVVSREPDAALDLFSFVPRVLLNIDDLPGTGLITQGSRVRYRLQMAGPPQVIADYRHWAEPRLGRGERIEDISDARPEVRSAIQKAQRFLGLASMVAVALAVIAIALATRRYVQRHLDSAAIMRCLGASQARLWQIYLWQFLLLALVSIAFTLWVSWQLDGGGGCGQRSRPHAHAGLPAGAGRGRGRPRHGAASRRRTGSQPPGAARRGSRANGGFPRVERCRGREPDR